MRKEALPCSTVRLGVWTSIERCLRSLVSQAQCWIIWIKWGPRCLDCVKSIAPLLSHSICDIINTISKCRHCLQRTPERPLDDLDGLRLQTALKHLATHNPVHIALPNKLMSRPRSSVPQYERCLHPLKDGNHISDFRERWHHSKQAPLCYAEPSRSEAPHQWQHKLRSL
jgi:hypothetical protein